MRQAGLTKVHLGIDDAGEDMQAGGVDGLGGGRRRQTADRPDPAVRNSDIARADAVVIDERAAFDKKIEGLWHRRSSF